MPAERLDVAVLLRRVLQRNVEDDGVDAEVTEREVLRGGRFLNEEISLAVPEDGVGAGPSDVDVLPEACGQRRVYVVVEIAGGPLLVRLARGERARRAAVEKDIAAAAGLSGHERVTTLV